MSQNLNIGRGLLIQLPLPHCHFPFHTSSMGIPNPARRSQPWTEQLQWMVKGSDPWNNPLLDGQPH